MQVVQKNITREEKRKQKLDVILRNAATAFMNQGYYRTSLDDIAKMQNVTKPTLYYYIDNKEDILIKCEEQALLRINTMIDGVIDVAKSGFEILHDFIEDYIDLMTDDVIRCHVRHRGQMDDDQAAANSIKNHKELEYRVREIIRIGIKDKSIRDCNSTILAILLFDSLNGITGWYKSDGQVKQDELTEEVLALVSGGIRLV